MKTTFEKVTELNLAFGNPKGDLSKPDVKAIRRQAMLCLEEAIEIVEAAYPGSKVEFTHKKDWPENDQVNMIALMDAQGDLTTVNDGVAHVAGFNGNRVYNRVHDSNLSKFCTTVAQALEALEWYYTNKGFQEGDLTLSGKYPMVCIKVVRDINLNGKFYPAGKFLKNMLTFREPDFSDLLNNPS